jgi:hypothetical protein
MYTPMINMDIDSAMLVHNKLILLPSESAKNIRNARQATTLTTPYIPVAKRELSVLFMPKDTNIWGA